MAGLRERKKRETRAAIQANALRLFREQGYPATTVNQIAEAAHVSQTTFFRYFPTKEDVVLQDLFDAAIVEAFREQPRELAPIEALRRAVHATVRTLGADDLARERDRQALVASVPELRARVLDQFAASAALVADLLGERVGLPADDFRIRNFAGVVIGVSIAAMLSVGDDPEASFLDLIDAGLAHLDAGLPLYVPQPATRARPDGESR